MSDRTVCAHHNRPSECQQCEDEIPSFLKRDPLDVRCSHGRQVFARCLDCEREQDKDAQIATLTAKLARVRERLQRLKQYNNVSQHGSHNMRIIIDEILREVGQ